MQFLESNYGSFGSKWGLTPYSSQAQAPPPFTFGLPFGYNTSHNPTLTANVWAPLVSQGIYKDDLWTTDQATQFAPRVMHLAGAFTSSILNIASGEGKTRPAFVPGEAAGGYQKYAIGEIHVAEGVRGGAAGAKDSGGNPTSYPDLFNIMGSVSFGTVNIIDNNEFEQPGEAYRRNHFSNVTGAENDTWIGGRGGPKMFNANANGPYDARSPYAQEGDDWNIQPADVDNMFGTSNVVLVDNKRGNYCSYELVNSGGAVSPPLNGGFIGNATGNRSLILGATSNSWINVISATGYSAGLAVADSWYGAPGWFCGCNGERTGSVIRSWKGLDIGAPFINCPAQVTVTAANALNLADQNPRGSGGSPLQVPDTFDESTVTGIVHPERYASIIRGDIVLGDSMTDDTDESGYDTDVLHIRDVIHLTPRTSPPTFSRNVAPSNRVGLMYFDAQRNSLRVSVAAHQPGTTARDWRDAEIAWVDVALNTGGVDPSRDIAGGDQSSRSLSSRSTNDVAAAIDNARTTASDQTSPYLEPHIEIADGFRAMLEPGVPSRVTLMTSGFQGAAPIIYWRRTGHMGKDNQRVIPWNKIEPNGLRAVTGLTPGSAFTLDVQLIDTDRTKDAPDTAQILEIMAINPETGQATGTSMRL